MRILHISSAVTYGGGERHLVDLCRGLAERGNDVFVAVRPTCRWRERLDFVPEQNVLTVSIRNSFGVFSAKRIADFARENEIEIIHAHVARDYIPASIASMVARDTKFVLTRHVLFPLKPFNKFALRNLSRAIAVSPAAADQLAAIFGPERVTTIANGIAAPTTGEDAGRAAAEFREFHRLPAASPLIGTIGQLTELKGQREFVIAAAEILKRHPEARFVVAGRDESAGQTFRRQLKRLAGVMGVDDRIVWLDWVEDLRPLLSAIDIYVSPSQTESFGLATLEAMLHARAVVATATEGSRELLGREDLLVPVGDPTALAARVSELLDDSSLLRSLGGELRSRALERFSLEKMVDETERLYREITTGPGN
ncbi:MAG: glycosyltransferase family 4 protein [Pyrinomonadaceae bacterium]